MVLAQRRHHDKSCEPWPLFVNPPPPTNWICFSPRPFALCGHTQEKKREWSQIKRPYLSQFQATETQVRANLNCLQQQCTHISHFNLIRVPMDSEGSVQQGWPSWAGVCGHMLAVWPGNGSPLLPWGTTPCLCTTGADCASALDTSHRSPLPQESLCWVVVCSSLYDEQFSL